MATATVVPEVRPPSLEADAEQPPLFDGTTRLYMAYYCPFAQRAWITRNYKGLQDKIKLVPLNLQNRPAWYKEKVNPTNKVPALEHNGKVIGESLDLIKYIDSNFEGPSLFPDDAAKRQFGEELIAYTDTFTGAVYPSFKGDPAKEAGPQFDYLENALQKFDDGPFLLGQFSGVDIAYITFIERFYVFLNEVFKYDIREGRPHLATWIEEFDKIDAYKQTKYDPIAIVELYKKRFMGLQDKINLVPLNLYNRPDWYKEKVYPLNKAPSLEHNGKVIGESLDLIKYVDGNFEGSSLLPDDPAKREYAEELLSYSDTFLNSIISSFKGDTAKEAGAQFDYLENALQKFDGTFFLGEISQVDIAYMPFVERYQIFLFEAFKIDITEGRLKLSAWIEEFNKNDAYKQTKYDPKAIVEHYRKRFLA